MKRAMIQAATAITAVFFAGCQTLPPGAEPGPHGTMAYTVTVEASEPGARIEANGQDVGNTPVQLKIFGDPDGTFHDFGSPYFVIKALPLATNQFEQVRFFGTGQWFGPPEEHIPAKVYFNMNQRTPSYPAAGPPGYYYPYYPYYGPPYYYGAPYPFYYGPGFRFYFGSGHYHDHGHDGIHSR